MPPLPPPPRVGAPAGVSAAAHAAVEEMDFSIHGLSMRGLGGSMNALDSFFDSTNALSVRDDAATEDVLLRQFLNQALSLPGDEATVMDEGEVIGEPQAWETSGLLKPGRAPLLTQH